MEYTVYILVSTMKKSWSYVGSTSNLERRYKDHMAGKTKSTKPFRPLQIIYTETYPTREMAYRRELYFKTGTGREQKENIIKYSGLV